MADCKTNNAPMEALDPEAPELRESLFAIVWEACFTPHARTFYVLSCESLALIPARS
jgi:hypothetical protein